MTDLFQTTCPCCGQPMPDKQESPFEQFWQSIPKGQKHGNKQSAEKAWKRLTPSEQQLAADRLATFQGLTKEECIGAAQTHISTYLNKRRFLDEVVEAKYSQPKTDRCDILRDWSKRFKALDKMPSYLLPRPDLVRELLEAGMITNEDVRRHMG